MKLWKRNAVVAVIVLFVCAAVYLNWSYSQEGNGVSAGTGKVLGEAALVGGSGADTDALFGNKGGASPTPSASDGTETQAPQTSSGYFASARLNRQQARDNALSLLQEAAEDEKADQAAVDEANAAIQTMADYTMTEAQIENLITAKGYTDCVAFLGEDEVKNGVVSMNVMASGVQESVALTAAPGWLAEKVAGLGVGTPIRDRE